MSQEPLTEEGLRERYGYIQKNRKSYAERLKARARCNSHCVKDTISSSVPILRWLPRYPLRKFIVGDLVSGITTAVVRIPQGLAYGLLAGLLPINGLYTGFFSPLVYSIFGTSRHISVGVFSVVSLMLGSALDKYNTANPVSDNAYGTNGNNIQYTSTTTTTPLENSTILNTNCNYTSSGGGTEVDSGNLAVICSLSVMIGLILFLLGVCRLGIIAMFLSDPLVSAFTTGAAIYVVTAQLKYVTGIPLQRRGGAFSLINTYVELFSKLGDIQWASVILSTICLVILVPIKYVNRTYKAKLRNMPIPVELIIVILGTVISSVVDFHCKYSVRIVGPVPSGMPSPILPQPSIWPNIISDAISIAVVIFAVAVSMGKIFAKKHGYTIDPNQELIALGLCQITCGFFRGHSGGGALARSVVQESSGGNSQVAALFSCIILLLVLLVIGPLFETLPIACLSCIILANLHGLLMQFSVLPDLWKLDKYDFCVWVFTFISVILLGVDLGLAAGVVFSLCCGGIRTSRAKITVLGILPESDHYKDIDLFQNSVQIPGIKIIRFSQSPTYANKSILQQITPSFFSRDTEVNVTFSETRDTADGSESAKTHLTVSTVDEHSVKPQIVIIDCSNWSVLDTVGMSTLKNVLKDLVAAELKVFMACVNDDIYEKLVIKEIVSNNDSESLARVYPSVSCAVAVAKTFVHVPNSSEA